MSTAVGERILFDCADGVAEIAFNRPEKLNALDHATFLALETALERLAGDHSVRVLVLRGVGRAFSAGLDFSEFRSFLDEAESDAVSFGATNGQGRRDSRLGSRIVLALRALPVPTIAALNGPAMGGALQLALACDLRVVGPDVKLAAKEIDFGITLDLGGTQLLPRLVGPDRALELMLTGRVVDAAEALRLGLATSLSDDPTRAARDLALAISACNPEAVAATKGLVRLAETAPFAVGLEAERAMLRWNIGRPNQSEAARAYFERRQPVFTGLDVDDLPPPLSSLV